MFNLKTLAKTAAITLAGLAFAPVAFADGHTKVLRIQSVLPTTGDEIKMVRDFGEDVYALTGGSLKLEVLAAVQWWDPEMLWMP